MMLRLSIIEGQSDLIRAELRALENREEITILWACESGSRAWGFESTDSDYDVRFIYVRRVVDYLRVSPTRDVIEFPVSNDLDISGWDISKALGLLRKSNPPLLEWLQSPIVYSEFPGFREEFWELGQRYFCPRGCMYHYISMAERGSRSYLQAETIRLKRYFYMLRPLLACQWLSERRGVVPMRFETLLDEFLPDGEVRGVIDELLERKRAGVESDDGPTIPILSEFIVDKMNVFKEVVSGVEFGKSWEPLDDFFRSTLAKVERGEIS